MTAWLRRAGRGRTADDAWAIWSVAEGRRGRRWREVRYRGTHVISSLLLETGPEGRFSHLEASTASGLVTLHPEGDGTLHGNVVSEEDVEPVAGLPWHEDGFVLLEGSALCATAAVRPLASSVPSFSSRLVVCVWIPLTLLVWETERIRVDRIDDHRWRIGGGEPFNVDGRGLPVLSDAAEWPLEE